MKKRKGTDLIENFSDYSEGSLIMIFKTILSSGGPLGVVLSGLFFDLNNNVKALRLQRFVKALEVEQKNISKKLENLEQYFSSEDFYDLTITIFNSALKTQSEEKIKVLSKIYTSAILNKINWETDLTQVIIECLNKLSTNHILIFKFLVNNINELNNLNEYKKIFELFRQKTSNHEVDKYLFRMYLKDLDNLSLIHCSNNIQEYESKGSLFTFQDYKDGENIIITTIGERLSKYLHNIQDDN